MARTKKPRARSARDAARARSSLPRTTGKIGATTRDTSNPSLSSPTFIRAASACSRFRRTGSVASTSSAASAAPQAAGGSAVVNTNVRAFETRRSTSRREPATYAPNDPSAFPSVPMWTSTRSVTPSASASPAPVGPSTPVAWASST